MHASLFLRLCDETSGDAWTGTHLFGYCVPDNKVILDAKLLALRARLIGFSFCHREISLDPDNSTWEFVNSNGELQQGFSMTVPERGSSKTLDAGRI